MACRHKIDAEELQRTNEALLDEMRRFNAALERGAYVVFHAKAGDRQVLRVETGGWYGLPRSRGPDVEA
jgi:hypothetical protein